MSEFLDYRRLPVGGKKGKKTNKQYFLKLGISVQTCRKIAFVTEKHWSRAILVYTWIFLLFFHYRHLELKGCLDSSWKGNYLYEQGQQLKWKNTICFCAERKSCNPKSGKRDQQDELYRSTRQDRVRFLWVLIAGKKTIYRRLKNITTFECIFHWR